MALRYNKIYFPFYSNPLASFPSWMVTHINITFLLCLPQLPGQVFIRVECCWGFFFSVTWLLHADNIAAAEMSCSHTRCNNWWMGCLKGRIGVRKCAQQCINQAFWLDPLPLNNALKAYTLKARLLNLSHIADDHTRTPTESGSIYGTQGRHEAFEKMLWFQTYFSKCEHAQSL